MEYFICQYIVKHRWHIQSIIKYNNEQSKRAGGQFLLSSAKTDTLVQWLSFIFISIVIIIVVKPESEVPKSKVPKSRPKGLGLTLKSHGPPTPPPPPITFRHEGVL